MLGRALAVKVAQSLAISMLRCTVVSNGENPPKISSLDVISRDFSSKFHQIHLINLSGHYCLRFIFKSCQTVAVISIASQFHDFVLNLVYLCSDGETPATAGAAAAAGMMCELHACNSNVAGIVDS